MNTVKEIIIKAIGDLPADNLNEILDFILFLKQRKLVNSHSLQKDDVHSSPATQLNGLVGLVAWGGDALADQERAYENEQGINPRIP